MRTAAEEGDAQAQCYLGVCFQNGQGVPQDYHEAVKWFRKSAEQNDPVAQCYLGVCYWMGQGVPQEFGEAAQWLREAAEQDDPAAQFNLGMLYETGQGVPQNYAEAVKWYRESAERGYPAAQFNLGVFYEQARSWRRIFWRPQNGISPPPNRNLRTRNAISAFATRPDAGWKKPQEAVKWFIRAARQGNKTAQHNLGLHYAAQEAKDTHAAEAARNTPR